uniref:Multivesicular body subunit 12Bb n=1 Tax=Poecilia formosa TaxID=48698 RepID=A0A096M5A3_POEFO
SEEAAMRKRRLCVKMSTREAAETAVCDIQITAKSKFQLVNYTCVGEINNMGIWYRMGDVPRSRSSQQRRSPSPDSSASKHTPNLRKHSTVQKPRVFRGEFDFRPQYQQENSGIYTMSALDDVPFMVSEKFHVKPQQMQQVSLMGITIKSLAEIEEEVSRGCNARLPPPPPLAQNAKQT